MQTARDFGLSGVNLTPGDHICAIYMGQAERDDIVLPYLRAGLASGDKVVCVIDSPVTELQASLGDDREMEAYIASHQLELYPSDEAYLRTRPFSTEAVLDFWDSTVAAATRNGTYGFGRGSGEMPSEMSILPARTEFFRYEAAVNRFAPRYPQAYLCLYDLERFGGGILVDLLRTHPKLLMGGLVLENPHYRPPDDLATPPN